VTAAVASDDAAAGLVAARLRRGRTVARGKNEGGNRYREEGNRAAGPVGGMVGTVVGGTAGAVSGGVKGALGVSDKPKKKKTTNN